MRFFLISDNSDAMNGLRLAGIEGTVARSEADLRNALEMAAQQPDIAVLLVTEKIAETYTATLDSARAADLPLLKNVELPAGTVLEADDSITLGGLKGANPAKGVAADDTLEARLEAQHDWFLENAGLEINI